MADLLEQVFCFWVIWVRVWVQFTCALAIRAFDFISTCSAIYF
jgi:hypothetical protein